MNTEAEYDHPSWLNDVFRPEKLKQLTFRSLPKLKAFRKENPFEALAFLGMSGAMLAPILSYELQVPMVLVRKDNDLYGPGGNKAPACGLKSFKSYIIIDDLVASGSTLKRIHSKVTQFCDDPPDLVGVATYYNHSGRNYISDVQSPTDKKLPMIALWDY